MLSQHPQSALLHVNTGETRDVNELYMVGFLNNSALIASPMFMDKAHRDVVCVQLGLDSLKRGVFRSNPRHHNRPSTGRPQCSEDKNCRTSA